MMRSNLEIIPTERSQLQVKFKVSFEFKTYNWIRHEGSPLVEYNGKEISRDERTSAAVAIVGPLWSYRIKEAARRAIGDLLSDDDCTEAARFVVDDVKSILQNPPKHAILNLQFKIQAVKTNVSVVECVDDDVVEECMSFVENRCCSICLEDFLGRGGGGQPILLKAPCSHVFHGGCIGEWLRKSQFCPLCRHKIPYVPDEFC